MAKKSQEWGEGITKKWTPEQKAALQSPLGPGGEILNVPPLDPRMRDLFYQLHPEQKPSPPPSEAKPGQPEGDKQVPVLQDILAFLKLVLSIP